MEKEKIEQWKKFCKAKEEFVKALDVEIMKCRLKDAGLKVIKDRKNQNGK